MTGQSESLPMTMPTTGSLSGPLMTGSSVLLLDGRAGEGKRVVHDRVGEVARRSHGARPDGSEIGAQCGDVPELASGALPLAVPVRLQVRRVRHEGGDAFFEAGAVVALPRRGAAEDVGHHHHGRGHRGVAQRVVEDGAQMLLELAGPGALD